jgi:hypothetical protein
MVPGTITLRYATGRSERPRPALLSHPAAEGRTRDPRSGHLKDHLATHAPTLAQAGFVDLESDRGEILAEETIGQLTPETALPCVEVLPLKRVQSLPVAAVVLSVADEVANEPTPQTSRLRPGCAYLYGSKGRLLPDASPPGVLVGVGSRVTKVDRVESCHRARLRN